ncbi:MAG: hypothetical protein M3304_04605, partial [Actinomycetota bacterium]|nr:hypothetical protein [Actinomycetota bacterium]
PGRVSLEFRAEEGLARLACGPAAYALHTFSAEDFPRLPDIDAVCVSGPGSRTSGASLRLPAGSTSLRAPGARFVRRPEGCLAPVTRKPCSSEEA